MLLERPPWRRTPAALTVPARLLVVPGGSTGGMLVNYLVLLDRNGRQRGGNGHAKTQEGTSGKLLGAPLWPGVGCLRLSSIRSS